MNESAISTALYLRVSSDMQREQGTSISAQRRELREYAVNQGWKIVAEYVDEGESAKTDDRPHFQRMVSDVLTGRQFDQILVYSLDRFARNTYDSAIYRQKLKKAGVRLLSFTERTEDTPEGRLLETVVESFAQYYSDRLGAVTKRGQKEIALRGFLSGGSAPFGYAAVKKPDGSGAKMRTTLEPHPVYATVVQQIFTMRAQGVSRRDIGEWLDGRGIPPPRRAKWSDRTIDEITANETYLGKIIFNRRPSRSAPHIRENSRDEWIIVENAHPALVSKVLFDEANRTRTRRGKQNVRQWNRHVYLLTGLIQCAKCRGPAISRRSDNRHDRTKPYYYYTCRNQSKERTCDAPVVRCDDLDTAVLFALQSQPLDELAIQRLWNELTDAMADPLLKTLQDDIADKERRRDNLLRALEEGRSKVVASRVDDLEEQIKMLSGRLANLELSRSSQLPRSIDELKKRLKVLAERLHSVDRKELRNAIHAFVAEITLNFHARTARVAYILPIRRSAEVVSKGNCGGVI